MSQQLLSCRQQLVEVREQYDKHLLEVQAEAKTQRATAHEERVKDMSSLKDQHERYDLLAALLGVLNASTSCMCW